MEYSMLYEVHFVTLTLHSRSVRVNRNLLTTLLYRVVKFVNMGLFISPIIRVSQNESWSLSIVSQNKSTPLCRNLDLYIRTYDLVSS